MFCRSVKVFLLQRKRNSIENKIEYFYGPYNQILQLKNYIDSDDYHGNIFKILDNKPITFSKNFLADND